MPAAPASASDSTPPWYKDGLPFQCTACGNCCTGAPGYVWINQAEINALAECLQISAADFESQYVRRVGIRRSLVERDNYDCVFLDPQTRRCQVYQARPRQCRTWPFWKSNVKSPTAWQQTCEVCPGSGTGDLYSLEAIEQRVREIDL